MMPEGLDFLTMVAGVPYIGFASACLSLSRGTQDRSRWEWLGAFGAMACLHLWLDLVAPVAPGFPGEITHNLVMGAAFLCLFGFACSALTGVALRMVGAYIVLAVVLCVLVATQQEVGRDITAALLGVPSTALACWTLHKWADGQPRHSRALALAMATALPFVVLTELLLSHDGPMWAPTLVALLVGLALAILTVALNAQLLGAHSAAVGRSYAMHAVVLLLVLVAIIGSAWAIIGRLTRLQRMELQAVSERRDLVTATAVRAANESAMRIAVALSAEPFIIRALESAGAFIVEANSELDRYAVAFDCKGTFLLDTAGNVTASSNREAPDSLVGRNLAYREYFAPAMAGQVQALILRDVTSRTRGLLAAAPVYANPRRVVGVSCVTIGLEDMEDEWDPAATTVLVDAAGKIWMTSDSRLLYQQLWQDDDAGTTQPIERVEPRFGARPGRSLKSGDVIEFDSAPHLVTKTPAGPRGFALISITNMRPIERGRGIALIVTGALSALTIVVGVSLRLRADSAMARKQQESLTTSISEMERVMSVLSHDLRSPLAASKATADYLLMADNLDSETRNCLRSIGDEQMRMSDMVTRLLDAIRIRNGGIEWAWEPLDARQVIESSFRTVAALPQRRTEVNVELQVDSLPETMRGDAQAISRLVVNLGANAVRHTYRGTVRVRASCAQNGAGQWLKVEVRDSGEGIGPSVLPLLGKPFVLGGKSSAAGSGLGLAIAIGICVAHGGKLTVASRLGVGSTFTAWLRADLDQPVKTRSQAGIEVVEG